MGGGTEDTVVKILQELLTQPKVIKHIQRGYIGSRNENTVTVSLSGFTNINKMIVICDGWVQSVSNRDYRLNPAINSLTVNALKLIVHSTSTTQYDWIASYQVIEFC